MAINEKLAWQRVSIALAVILLALGWVLAAALCASARPANKPQTNPWKSSQVIEPAALAKVLSKHSGRKPAVVCAGFDFLFQAAHIPGAAYAGPAREARGLEALKKWAERIPRHQEVVLYCGCCPFSECPNIRPAFKALRAMGFTNLKVLDLPDNFQKDWMAKGYPIVKE